MANKLELCMKGAAQSHVYLEDLQPGPGSPIMVMINRRWDVYNVKGTYLTTDFNVSDQKMNAIHCIATHNRAHRLLQMLKEGSVYMLSGFKVLENRKDFQIIEDSPYMLEFDGSTYAKKATVDVNSFVRYCFQITEFNKLVPVDNKYLIGNMRKKRCLLSLLLYTSSEDEADPLPFNYTNPKLTEPANHGTILASQQKNCNDKGKGPLHIKHPATDMEDSEDDEDTKPICILYKKDIKGDTSFLYPTNPGSSPQGTGPSQQPNSSSNNAPTNEDEPMNDSEDETTDDTHLPTSSTYEPGNNDTAQSTPRRQYLLRPRLFKAKKMKPGEDGESEKNPIVVL